MKTGKKITALLLAAFITASMAACSSGSETSETSNTNSGSSASGEEIVIKYPTYRVGTHTSAKAETELINGFNEKYAGKYRVEVEELPSDESYADKMKVLAANNELPDVVEGKNGVRELAIANGQAIDLTELVNADEEFKQAIGEDAIKANTIDDKL